MASARIAELQADLTAARKERKLELEKVPIDYTKPAVYKDIIDNLTDELKIYNSTPGEFLH